MVEFLKTYGAEVVLVLTTDIFMFSIGTELIYRQCGVRFHMSDRSMSQNALKSLSSQDVQHFFGAQEHPTKDLKTQLSDLEIRKVKELLDFPYLLATAFLMVCVIS